jgi:hypothetical protein
MVRYLHYLESGNDRIKIFAVNEKGRGSYHCPPHPLPPPHAISGLLALIIQEEDPVTRIEPEEEVVLLTNMAAKYQTDQVPTVWYVAVPGLQVPYPTFDEYRYLVPYTWKYTTIPRYLCTVQDR